MESVAKDILYMADMDSRSSIGGVSPEEADMGVPMKVPSITEIKKKIPAHCFKPKLTTSFYYVFVDLLIVSGLYVSMLLMEKQPFYVLTCAYMPVYWFLQGTMFAAIFCLGHDCGHESFSNSRILNDTVGTLLHSFILVPYYPWKLTHKHHHKNTGNIDKDEVFYPIREDQKGANGFVLPYFGLGLGWIGYVVKGYNPRPVPHLNPSHPLLAKHFLQCCSSLACMGLWTYFALMPYASSFGFYKLLVHYLMPVFGFACWIVFITFLHHHDEKLPWYADHRWDFVRGQLSSVDRHYGLLHGFLHNIGTHQIHHLFSKIPHYHLEEATRAFRDSFPDLVRTSDEPLVPAFMRMFHLYAEQSTIMKDTEVHVYQDKKKQN